MSHSIAKWLEQDDLPDLYRLLGKPRLDPDIAGLEAAIHAATRELLPYQNHADTAKAQRAMRLLFELGRVEDLLADPRRFGEFNQKLTADLLDRCREHFGESAASWRPEQIQFWLETDCGVHPTASRKAAAILLEKAGRTQPSTVRVFASPGSKEIGVPAGDHDPDPASDDLLAPISSDLLPPRADLSRLHEPQQEVTSNKGQVTSKRADLSRLHEPQPVALPSPAPAWPRALPAATFGTVMPGAGLPGAGPPRPVTVAPFIPRATVDESVSLHIDQHKVPRSASKRRLLTTARLLLLGALIAWVPMIVFLAIYFAPRDAADSGSKLAEPGRQTDNHDVPPTRRTSTGENSTVTRPARGGDRP